MTTTTPYRRRSRTRRLIVLVSLVVVVVLLAYAAGYRLNVVTRSVPVPGVDASADEVVLAYVEAYDARNFGTLRAIYPSQVPSRFRALSDYDDVRIVNSHAPSRWEQSGREFRADRQYWNVRVTLTVHVGVGGDESYPDGPNGWTYWLERPDVQHRWQIVDHGNG